MYLDNGIWSDHRNSKISPSHVPSIILVYSFNKMIIMNVMIFTKYHISKFCRLSGMAKSPLPICRIHGHWPPSAADLSRHQFKGGEGARSCQRESLPIFRSNKSLRIFTRPSYQMGRVYLSGIGLCVSVRHHFEDDQYFCS